MRQKLLTPTYISLCTGDKGYRKVSSAVLKSKTEKTMEKLGLLSKSHLVKMLSVVKKVP